MKLAAVLFVFALTLSGACIAEAADENPAPSPVSPAPSAANAAPSASSAALKSGTIDISTDHLEADDQRRLIFLKGNVTVRWEGRVLTCDEADITYQARKMRPQSGGPGRTSGDPGGGTEGRPGSTQKDEPDVQHEIVRIQARGHVKVTLENRVALSDAAVYDAQSRIITLSGNPRLWRGNDFLSGDRIKVFLDEDRSVVEGGGSEKVKLRLYQSQPEDKAGKTGTPSEGKER
jgi:lipopolysaccharide export system protein LptA